LELPALEVLDLSRNRVSDIPLNITRLSNLKVLALQGNLIQTVPHSLSDMEGLQVIKLENNPLISPLAEILTDGSSDGYVTTARIKLWLSANQAREQELTVV
jgi:hypothetical protein